MLSKDHKSLVYLTSYLMRYFTILNGTINTPVFKYCQARRTVFRGGVDILENSEYLTKKWVFHKKWIFQEKHHTTDAHLM